MALNSILSIKDTFDKYIVRPAGAFGLGGFVFDVEGDAVATLTADITDHYTEDNSPVQDHMAIRPKRIMLRNYVGELVQRLDPNTNTVTQNVVQKLTTLSAFAPLLSQGAQQAKSIFENGFKSVNPFSLSSLNAASSLWAASKNLIPPTQRQQQAYLFFKALQEQKILVSVQTPFEYMTNMAIETIVATQGEDSRYISDFAVTLKEMRFAQTKRVAFTQQKYKSPNAPNSGKTLAQYDPIAKQNRNVMQLTPPVNKGVVQGVKIDDLTSDPMFDKVYPPGRSLPPPLSLFNLPPVE